MNIKLYPGLEAWLQSQKHPDALVCKVLTGYRHRHTHRPVMGFCILVAGIMLGYAWRVYQTGGI